MCFTSGKQSSHLNPYSHLQGIKAVQKHKHPITGMNNFQPWKIPLGPLPTLPIEMGNMLLHMILSRTRKMTFATVFTY